MDLFMLSLLLAWLIGGEGIRPALPCRAGQEIVCRREVCGWILSFPGIMSAPMYTASRDSPKASSEHTRLLLKITRLAIAGIESVPLWWHNNF
jgi:hypothetical protein